MKWLSVFLVFLLPLSAAAADNTALKPLKETKPNYVVVDGKKFYSLQGARRFTGNTNSPGALMVVHHPHSPETIITHRNTISAVGTGGDTARPAAPSTAQPGDILSVFAPDEKGAPLLPPTASPTK